jgi:hypothetical protein
VIERVDRTLAFLDLLATWEQAPNLSDCSMLEEASVSSRPPPSHLQFVHCGTVAAAGCDARIVGEAGTLVRPGRLEIAAKKRSWWDG